MTKSLSLVMPAYKQEKTIVSDILSLDEILRSLVKEYEIIVVLDGKVDLSEEKLKGVKNLRLKVISYDINQGKGYAVRVGMLSAKSDIIGFIDSGKDINADALSIALDLMEFHNADIVVGSKLHPDSKVNYPPIRHFMTLCARTTVKLLFNLNVKDTQVGLKIFKRNVARDVFSRIVVKRFGFDIEVLAVAKMLGYDKIYESPIKINFKQGTITNSNFWIVLLSTLWDTLAVFYRMHVLRYYSKKHI